MSLAAPLAPVLGVNRNILRSLRSRGCRVVVLPHTADWRAVLAIGADGLMLSNGLGDPAVLDAPVELCREALRQGMPLFGICLGHQILGGAVGGETVRLPFGHHAANHPVSSWTLGACPSRADHEFQVLAASLPDHRDVAASHVHDPPG